jgi:translation initiation factor 1 (eIF-1/SUI1)
VGGFVARDKRRTDRSQSALGSRELTHTPFAGLAHSGAPSAAPLPAADASAGSGAKAGDAQSVPVASAAAPALSRKLVVRRELKGRGGKTVTRISGLPREHREALAATMKKRFGCGALIDRDDVLLLGDLVDRAADWLAEQGASRVVKGN